MRAWTKAASVAVVTGAMLAAGPGAALAHECFVANRSAQGNAAVSANSAAWFTITPEILFGEIFQLSGAPLTCAVDAWNADSSLPSYIVVGAKQAVGQEASSPRTTRTSRPGKASDGRGSTTARRSTGRPRRDRRPAIPVAVPERGPRPTPAPSWRGRAGRGPVCGDATGG